MNAIYQTIRGNNMGMYKFDLYYFGEGHIIESLDNLQRVHNFINVIGVI